MSQEIINFIDLSNTNSGSSCNKFRNILQKKLRKEREKRRYENDSETPLMMALKQNNLKAAKVLAECHVGNWLDEIIHYSLDKNVFNSASLLNKTDNENNVTTTITLLHLCLDPKAENDEYNQIAEILIISLAREFYAENKFAKLISKKYSAIGNYISLKAIIEPYGCLGALHLAAIRSDAKLLD